MKKFFAFALIGAVVLGATMMTSCNKEKPKVEPLPNITMVSDKSGIVNIYLEGNCPLTIDWGDGSRFVGNLAIDPDNGSGMNFSHTYHGTTERTISIFGDNITWVECNDSGLTELNVTNCSKLEYLDVYGGKLTSLDLSGLANIVWVSATDNLMTFEALRATLATLPVPPVCSPNLGYLFFTGNPGHSDINSSHIPTGWKWN